MFTQSSIVGWVNDPFLLHPSAPRSNNTMHDGFAAASINRGWPMANWPLSYPASTISVPNFWP